MEVLIRGLISPVFVGICFQYVEIQRCLFATIDTRSFRFTFINYLVLIKLVAPVYQSIIEFQELCAIHFRSMCLIMFNPAKRRLFFNIKIILHREPYPILILCNLTVFRNSILHNIFNRYKQRVRIWIHNVFVDIFRQLF